MTIDGGKLISNRKPNALIKHQLTPTTRSARYLRLIRFGAVGLGEPLSSFPEGVN